MKHELPGAQFRAVIPSLAGSLDRLAELTQALASAGADPLVVPTGASVQRALHGSRVPFIEIKANPGFSATIAHGAVGEWDWLLVVNDDVTVDAVRLGAALASLKEYDRDTMCLAFLDPVEPKPVPTIPDALLGLSLLGPVLARLGLTRETRRTKTSDTFRPFSFVAISRRLWEELGGLDQEFIYTFEDADFSRRAHASGATLLFPDDTGVSHRRYGTSTSRIRAVLPCSAVSTATYLQTLGMRPGTARAACLAALAVRTPLVLVAGLPKREHLAGITAAGRAFVFRRRPNLPDYAAN